MPSATGRPAGGSRAACPVPPRIAALRRPSRRPARVRSIRHGYSSSAISAGRSAQFERVRVDAVVARRVAAGRLPRRRGCRRSASAGRSAGRPPGRPAPGTTRGWRPTERSGQQLAERLDRARRSRWTARWRALSAAGKVAVEQAALRRDHAAPGWSARRSAARSARGTRGRRSRRRRARSRSARSCRDGDCAADPSRSTTQRAVVAPRRRACTRSGGVSSKPSSSMKPSTATARSGHERNAASARRAVCSSSASMPPTPSSRPWAASELLDARRRPACRPRAARRGRPASRPGRGRWPRSARTARRTRRPPLDQRSGREDQPLLEQLRALRRSRCPGTRPPMSMWWAIDPAQAISAPSREERA